MCSAQYLVAREGQVPNDTDTVVQDLLAQSKVWKMATNQSLSVSARAAIFDLLGAAAKSIPESLGAVLKRPAVAAFGGLSDMDTTIIRSSWNAVFHLIMFVPDLWTAVNPRKAVWPHVWKLIKEGGRGVPSVFAHMSSWLSKVPDDVIGEGTGFHKALWDGLRDAVTVVGRGRGNAKVVTDCMLEVVLHFLIRKPITEGESGGAASDPQIVKDYISGRDEGRPRCELTALHCSCATSYAPIRWLPSTACSRAHTHVSELRTTVCPLDETAAWPPTVVDVP